MKNIEKTFYIITFFILSLFMIVFYHYIFFSRDETIDNIVKLTTINSPSFCVSWHEERLRDNKKFIYSPYPEMPSADRLTFIYGEDK